MGLDRVMVGPGFRLDRSVPVGRAFPKDPGMGRTVLSGPGMGRAALLGPGLDRMGPVALGIRVISGYRMAFLSMGSLLMGSLLMGSLLMGSLLMEFLQSGIRWPSLLSSFDSFPFSES